MLLRVCIAHHVKTAQLLHVVKMCYAWGVGVKVRERPGEITAATTTTTRGMNLVKMLIFASHPNTQLPTRIYYPLCPLGTVLTKGA